MRRQSFFLALGFFSGTFIVRAVADEDILAALVKSVVVGVSVYLVSVVTLALIERSESKKKG